MLDMVAKGGKINLARDIMDKMLVKLRQKISSAKKKTLAHQKVTMPYMTIITHFAKSLSS